MLICEMQNGKDDDDANDENVQIEENTKVRPDTHEPTEQGKEKRREEKCIVKQNDLFCKTKGI